MNAAPAGVNPWVIALVVSLATFMEVLDTTITNVSLSHIAGTLSASQDESTWVLTSYLVANGIVLPLSGWLSDTIGRKRFFHGLYRFIHRGFLCLRRVRFARHADLLPAAARLSRRRFAADPASDYSRRLSRRKSVGRCLA